MAQQLSLITLSIKDIARSRRFYGEGFGWKPVFESDEIVFFQMNGIVLGLWLAPAFSADLQRPDGQSNGFALAHNVESAAAVDALIARLAGHGGHVLREPDAPAHGGGVAMWLIPMAMPGRSHGIRPGRSMPRGG